MEQLFIVCICFFATTQLVASCPATVVDVPSNETGVLADLTSDLSGIKADGNRLVNYNNEQVHIRVSYHIKCMAAQSPLSLCTHT